MGLIQKLEQIKSIKNDIKSSIAEKGGIIEDSTPFGDYAEIISNLNTGDNTDYSHNVLNYLCYGFDNYNLVKLLCDNIVYVNDEKNNYNYTFRSCAVNPDFFNFKPQYWRYTYNTTPPPPDHTHPFGYGNEYFNHLEHTFDYFNNEILNVNFEEYLPTMFDSSFYYASNLKNIVSNNDNKLWVAYASSTFYNCSNLEQIPKLSVEKCITFNYMFYNCNSLKKVEFEGRPLVSDYKKGEYINFLGVGTQPNLSNMFYNCNSLESITGLDLTYANSDMNTSNMFQSCRSLHTLDFTGTEDFNINLDLKTTGLDRTGLMNMLATLPAIDHTQTITIGDKMSLLTDLDIAEFTTKGYTLA